MLRISTLLRGRTFSNRDVVSAGLQSVAPRADEDFTYVGGNQVIPGAHPLPMVRALDTTMNPHVSPYIPSPHRQHPYFVKPIAELPHFDTTTPIVYGYNIMKTPIVAPVFNLDGEVTHTRALDPFIFGHYPQTTLMSQNSAYWQVRCQNYKVMWDFHRSEIWKRAKKPWANTGTGRYRARDLRSARHPDGGRKHAQKPWTALMPTILPQHWSASNRMMLSLKMLQGRVQIVDKLSLEEPTADAFLKQCQKMSWDVRMSGAGVMFMDGGSRITPSIEFDRNFFYGSFHNGRCKLVRPTVQTDMPYDWNFTGALSKYMGPRGPKNPIPLNRFNCYDAMYHDILVITEGALMQLEKECFREKVDYLPPHIRSQMAASGMLDHFLTHAEDGALPLIETIEFEAAARTEEKEAAMYEGFYDNPYKPWADEDEASYVVDGVEGYITREVNGKKASWAMLS